MKSEHRNGNITPEAKGVAECGKETNSPFFFGLLLDPFTFLIEYVFSTCVFGDVFLCSEIVLRYNSQHMSRLS
jgi:hypothetical protein